MQFAFCTEYSEKFRRGSLNIYKLEDNIFKSYARYYDLLYKDKDYSQEAQFVRKLLMTYAPKAKSILELGCGTGRHAAQLAKDKYTVHGVDFSRAMLKQCTTLIKKLPADIASRLSFCHGDMRSVRLNHRFDAIISLFHVICYQTNNDDLRATFKTVKTHLKPRGLFIFDCWYGPAVLTDRPSVRIKRMEDEKNSITRIAEPVMYPNENCVDVNYAVWIRDKQAGKVEEVKETHRVRYLFQPEIEQMLALSGLSLISAQEWLSGNELDFNTWNGCFIAENK